MASIVVVVLNWNGCENTIQCLESLNRVTDNDFSVVVVDNASTDGSAETIASLFPTIPLLRNPENLGYAGGNNTGIRWALRNQADHVLLLNNDTLLDPTVITELRAAARGNPVAGIYGPRIYYANSPDRLWFDGAKWNPSTLDFEHIGIDALATLAQPTPVETDYITGCAILIARGVFERIGLLDERFFLTFEETDFCYRARQAGFRCMLVQQAKIWHKVSSSFGGKGSPLVEYFMARNRLLWAKRNLDRRVYLKIRKRRILEILEIVFAPLAPDSRAPLTRRYWWAMLSWYGLLQKRLAIPYNRAIVFGVLHFFIGRFGDCPAKLRRILTPALN